MEHSGELDRPIPEDSYFLNETERLTLLCMLEVDAKNRKTFTQRTWVQEFEFLWKFIAAPPCELNPAMRNHLRLMTAHAAQCIIEQYPHASEDYEHIKNRIHQAVLEDLRGSTIASLKELQNSNIWQNAYVDVIAHNNQHRTDNT